MKIKTQKYETAIGSLQKEIENLKTKNLSEAKK